MKLVYFFQQRQFSKLGKSYHGRHAYVDVYMSLRVKYEVYGVKDTVSAALMRFIVLMVSLTF